MLLFQSISRNISSNMPSVYLIPIIFISCIRYTENTFFAFDNEMTEGICKVHGNSLDLWLISQGQR